MKKYLFTAALISSLPAFADSVITFKDGVRNIPAEVQAKLVGYDYEVKEAWTKPMFAIQNLPSSPWVKAQRHANLALLVRGESFSQGWNAKSIKSVEENIPYTDEEELFGEPPFDPVKCDGIIYAFHHYSKTDQKLENASSCDNYALRPNGDYVYKITITSPTKKSVEVYEHGSLIASGSGELQVRFTYGYRQKYMIVRGDPGSYHIEIYPVLADIKKEKLNNWVFSDFFSNAYGYGIPAANKMLPNPPSTTSEWVGAHMMGAESLWEAGYTGKGVKVAVIDTGVDSNHPFLKDAVVGGYEVFNKGTTPADYQDVEGHGSHVAGIIHQVAPDAEILAVRVFSADAGGASVESIAAGVQWAIDHGAQVINMSLGGPDNPKNWPNLFKSGVNKGILFAVASGNERGFEPMFPAAYAGTIPGFGFSVGAADALMNMAVFSNWTGNNLNMKQVTGFGRRVLSVGAGTTDFIKMSGTSMASPQIAGYLALFKHAYPQKSNLEIIDLVTKYVQRASVND